MTRARLHSAREVIWETMVAHAEALHDVTVLGQANASMRQARRIAAMAADIASLARAAALLASPDKARRK